MINKGVLERHKKHGFNEHEIYGAYKLFFGTLVSKPRLKIINFLREGRKNVSEIISELKMNQTSVSHDLARLKRCGFVKVEVEGKFRYYKLNERTIKPLMELIDKHMSQYCIHILNERGENKNE